MKAASLIHSVWSSLYGKIAMACLAALYVFSESILGRNDLSIFLEASKALFSGEDIYKITYFDGYHYFYSVFFATIIYPFTLVPDWCSKACWLIVNMLLLYRIFQLCFYYLEIRNLKSEVQTLFGFLLFLVCLRFIRGNLHLGQVTIVMLFLSLEAIYQIQYGKKYLGGALLALAINIKILPVVLLPYLIYRKEWKVSLFVFCLLAVLYYLPALWLGNAANIDLLTSWVEIINPQQQRHMLDVEETSFHGLTTLLATLFIENIPEKYGLGLKRNIADVSVENLYVIIQSVRLLLIAGTLWFLRSLPFVRFGAKSKTWWELSYLLLLIPLIFPHQQHYAFLMALPAIGHVLKFLIASNDRSGRYKAMLFLSIGVFVVFNLSLILGVFTPWYNHFKILTYAALVLVGLLFYLVPQQSDLKSNVK